MSKSGIERRIPVAFARKVQGEFYKREWTRMNKVAWAVAGGFVARNKLTRQDAEDIVSEMQIRVWRYLRGDFGGVNKTFQSAQFPPNTWVNRVTKNLIVDHIRKDKTSPMSEELAESLTDGRGRIDEVDMEDALRRLPLPEHYRIALACKVDGMSGAEAANHLNITIHAYKMRLHRAQAICRKKLGGVL